MHSAPQRLGKVACHCLDDLFLVTGLAVPTPDPGQAEHPDNNDHPRPSDWTTLSLSSIRAQRYPEPGPTRPGWSMSLRSWRCPERPRVDIPSVLTIDRVPSSVRSVGRIGSSRVTSSAEGQGNLRSADSGRTPGRDSPVVGATYPRCGTRNHPEPNGSGSAQTAWPSSRCSPLAR